MTKQVCIENADQSSWVVVIERWVKGTPGEPDILAETTELPEPGQKATQHIWKEQYLVIRERAPDARVATSP